MALFNLIKILKVQISKVTSDISNKSKSLISSCKDTFQS